jgi:TonB family protein
MKKNRISFLATGIAFFLFSSVFLGACNNDDTNPPPENTVETKQHGTGMENKMMADTMKPATGAEMNAGLESTVGKPNPAKKGMKGKVTVMDNPITSVSERVDKTGVNSNIEVYPSFPDGSAALQKYFENHLTYPEDATNNGVEGTVKVMFTVDENGKLSGPHIMGEKNGYGLEEEALRVVKTMPAWNPGKLKGKNVKTDFTLPVNFQLY